MSNRDYQLLFHSGIKAQSEKLKENEHKEGFDSIPIKRLFKYLDDEIGELYDEVYFSKDIYSIRREAADVANYAHMIILACDNQIAESEKEKAENEENPIDNAHNFIVSEHRTAPRNDGPDIGPTTRPGGDGSRNAGEYRDGKQTIPRIGEIERREIDFPNQG